MPRTENERLKTFVDVICRQHRRSIAQLAKELDRSRDTLVGWLDNTRIPSDAIGFFSRNYGLQLDWFYYGHGPMILDTGGLARNEQGEIVRSGEPRATYAGDSTAGTAQAHAYPIPVMAVIGTTEASREDSAPTLETGRFICLFRPQLPGEVAVEIVGSSMEPFFAHGDIITCRPVPVDELRDSLDYVVLTERGPLFRQVTKDAEGNLLLQARNPAHADRYRPERIFACYEPVMHIHPYRQTGGSRDDVDGETDRPSTSSG